ncbi:hypothetical protein V2J09_002619 [Rumex salicifolius]
MALDRLHLLGFLVFSLMANWAYSSVISNAVFESHGSTGRSLLQTLKSCPVDFENQNYTIITNKCKGPKYAADSCCSSFKEFACPFVDEINDLSTDCATTMFSYINLYGKYPPGLFANECKEGKNGLDCSNYTSTVRSTNSPGKNGADMAFVLSPMALPLSCIVTFLLLVLV